MNKFVQLLLVAHPAGGWFRKNTSAKRKKQTNNNKFFSSPDSFHSRTGVTKRDNPRFNPAP
jgi:hypothetical protein